MMEKRFAYDVIVVGGGLTGCAAAVAAARRGAKVALLEANGFLGGATSENLVFPFMPYSTMVKDEKGEKTENDLSRGFLREITEDLVARGQTATRRSFIDEGLKCLLDEKMNEAGVQVLFHATLCGVKKNGTKLESVSVATKAGVLDFEGKVFVDATGDADLSVMAGVPTRLGRPGDTLCQPMTLCFRVGNVDKEAYFSEGHRLAQEKYKEWQASGRTSNPRENILVFDFPVDGVLHFNTTRVVKHDPTDPFDVTKAEMDARRQVTELMTMFREEKIPGMENAKLLYTAPSIGVRESRMIDGEYVLTQEDLIACTKYEDSIAAGNYDIDIHNPEGSGTSHYYFPEGTWYTIPYRTLIPKRGDCGNLLVGGRCISVTHEAQASVRIMPICATTGEAAGAAAALAVKDGCEVQDVNVKELQDTLAQSGAYLGI